MQAASTGAARASPLLPIVARPAKSLNPTRVSSVLVAFDSPALGRGQGLVVAPLSTARPTFWSSSLCPFAGFVLVSTSAVAETAMARASLSKALAVARPSLSRSSLSRAAAVLATMQSRSLDAPQMTPAQLRAARALLALPRPELAKSAIVPVPMIADYEAGVLQLRPEDLGAVQAALETAGVEFIDDVGVKLGKGAK